MTSFRALASRVPATSSSARFAIGPSIGPSWSVSGRTSFRLYHSSPVRSSLTPTSPSPRPKLSLQSSASSSQIRHSSYSLPPLPSSQDGDNNATTANSKPKRKKVTVQTLRALYGRGEPISMVTAYDYPTGLAADAAEIDTVLVGDSCAMVALGMPDTTEIGLDEMIIHSRAVSRAVQHAFIIADLPFGSYETSATDALKAAISLIKHGRAHAVKLEGGRSAASAISHIVHAGGIPVLAHIGLTPQRLHSLGGFRAQGRTADAALRLLDDALAVQEAGAFAVVIEAVAAPIAAAISARLRIPTIGIGAGNGCGGQVLVQADLCGALPNSNDHISSTRPDGELATRSASANHGTRSTHLPKFVKQYGNVWNESVSALKQYRDDVKSRAFPGKEHEYPISEAELADFAARLSAPSHYHHEARQASAGKN